MKNTCSLWNWITQFSDGFRLNIIDQLYSSNTLTRSRSRTLLLTFSAKSEVLEIMVCKCWASLITSCRFGLKNNYAKFITKNVTHFTNSLCSGLLYRKFWEYTCIFRMLRCTLLTLSYKTLKYRVHKCIQSTSSGYMFFYNNWANPRVLIGQELRSMRV